MSVFFLCVLLCCAVLCVCLSDLVLLEVTQCLYYNRTRTTTLLLRVTWSQPHDALGLIHQVLHLALILHDLLLLSLHGDTNTQVI